MDRAVSTHAYRTTDIDVSGGKLRVGIWEPRGITSGTVVAIHGITSSHLAWHLVADALPEMRVIAPDLRGRGRSLNIEGEAGMAAHADDVAQVLNALGIEQTLVAGHSMGAFAAVVLADRHPERVSRLVLVDGGLPLDVPVGLDPEALVQRILGPTAERLSRRWAGVEEYVQEFWQPHPAFAAEWSPQLEAYAAYDLVPDGDGFRAATSYDVTVEDTVDLNFGSAYADAFARLREPTVLLTAGRGLLDESPGLYAPEHLARVLAAVPEVRHLALSNVNHYTIVMSTGGAASVAAVIQDEAASGPV